MVLPTTTVREPAPEPSMLPLLKYEPFRAPPARVYFCPARTPYLVSDSLFLVCTGTPVPVYALSSG